MVTSTGLLKSSTKVPGPPFAPKTKVRVLLYFVILLFVMPFSVYAQSTIKIGFLIRDRTDLPVQRSAKLAIAKANEKGGYKGQKFELVTRSCDGPWGITSKQAVELIHEQGVLILVTALDGRNAHLAEQVVAKSHVVMLSTLSSDPTLSRAYVPWYHRIIPDDRQQAEKLVSEIYKVNKHHEVAVVALDDYDAKMSTEAFLREIEKLKLPLPVVIHIANKKELSKTLIQDKYESVVFAGTMDLSAAPGDFPVGQDTYAFLNCFNFMNVNRFPKGIRTVHDLSSGQNEYSQMSLADKNLVFKTDYPSHVYVFDGISIAVDAIIKLGPNPDEIRKRFGELKYEGLTGVIEFDSSGNRRLQ